MIGINFDSQVDEARAKEILMEICRDTMGGWFELPLKFDMEELAEIKAAAKKIQEEAEPSVN